VAGRLKNASEQPSPVCCTVVKKRMRPEDIVGVNNEMIVFWTFMSRGMVGIANI